MKLLGSGLLVALACAALTACGGGDDDVHYGKLVSFGDSLSDVGSYATPGVKALGGGKYTVNGNGAKIWVEVLAAQLGLPAPCAAQTGLEASGALASLAAPITNVPNCFAYGQGGSRVTNPVGVDNKALGSPLGQLTDPVVNQIQRHLNASGGKFNGDELVLVLAGGNDLFINLAIVGGGGDPSAAVTAMGTAGAELAGYVKTQIIAKGATRVVVVNLPDVSLTPFALGVDAPTRGLIQQMSATFNQQLQAGLNNVAQVLYVDAFTQGQQQAANPSQFGLSNVTTAACDPAKTGPFLTALACNANTLIAGDTSRYQYADSVHPTPYGHQLIAQSVAQKLLDKGWR